MFRLIRMGISVVALGVALWAAFVIDLGGKTFAEHVDTISATPEAEELIQGTRAKINPALQELRDRVLGEYVEAPTWIPADPSQADAKPSSKPGSKSGEPAQREQVPASTLTPGASFEPALPGRRREASKPRAEAPPIEREPEPEPEPEPGHEPALPGRR